MKRVNIKGLRRQAGVTILEFIAFIGLAALVIAGALGLYNSASSGASSNEIVQVANGIVQTLRQTYASNPPGSNPGVPPTTWQAAAVNVAAPQGWTAFTDGGLTRKGNQTITVTSVGNNAMQLVISVDKQKICQSLLGATIGGVRLTNPPQCAADGTATNLTFTNITP